MSEMHSLYLRQVGKMLTSDGSSTYIVNSSHSSPSWFIARTTADLPARCAQLISLTD
jgi:hypothetical protein